ncbi:dihydropteroate synthase [Kineococcus xinjiangensis]|uniref:Dihydropteroate synthase n=1 Tax=Kineococcus xinjiangensis TaxID=512762 RepID=A0A2S6IGU1_9ACTN|nr:dihydropteroate synthase [Kineococcus xinjiangensis]PPK93432.1 dihydropteroate synthase [Kineococcus xinjiangensis]
MEPGGRGPRDVAALLAPGRCRVVGVLNVTPDSFSDGGRWMAADAAVAHAQAMVAAGADLVDVGGESTRPGAQRVGADEEARRVLPIVERLAAAGVAVSVDTMRADVARRAVQAGAVVVNDVSGGLADEAMAAAVAATGALFVVSHWRGHSDVMTSRATYTDVVADVVAELAAARDRAVAAGVPAERVVLDPGLGFAKVGEHDWALLRSLDRLRALGHPLLVGASRKRFLGALLAGPDGAAPPAPERDAATAAVTALAAHAGAWGVRVHDVASSAAAVRVAAAWADPAAERPGPPVAAGERAGSRP